MVDAVLRQHRELLKPEWQLEPLWKNYRSAVLLHQRSRKDVVRDIDAYQTHLNALVKLERRLGVRGSADGAARTYREVLDPMRAGYRKLKHDMPLLLCVDTCCLSLVNPKKRIKDTDPETAFIADVLEAVGLVCDDIPSSYRRWAQSYLP